MSNQEEQQVQRVLDVFRKAAAEADDNALEELVFWMLGLLDEAAVFPEFAESVINEWKGSKRFTSEAPRLDQIAETAIELFRSGLRDLWDALYDARIRSLFEAQIYAALREGEENIDLWAIGLDENDENEGELIENHRMIEALQIGVDAFEQGDLDTVIETVSVFFPGREGVALQRFFRVQGLAETEYLKRGCDRYSELMAAYSIQQSGGGAALLFGEILAIEAFQKRNTEPVKTLCESLAAMTSSGSQIDEIPNMLSLTRPDLSSEKEQAKQAWINKATSTAGHTQLTLDERYLPGWRTLCAKSLESIEQIVARLWLLSEIDRAVEADDKDQLKKAREHLETVCIEDPKVIFVNTGRVIEYRKVGEKFDIEADSSNTIERDERFIVWYQSTVTKVLERLQPSFDIFQAAGLLDADIKAANVEGDELRLEKMGHWLAEIESAEPGSQLNQKIEELSGKWPTLNNGKAAWEQMSLDRHYLDFGKRMINEALDTCGSAEIVRAAARLRNDIGGAIDAGDHVLLKQREEWLTELQSAAHGDQLSETIEALSGKWPTLNNGKAAWEQMSRDEKELALGRKKITALLDYIKRAINIFKAAALLQSDIESAIDAGNDELLKRQGESLTALESAVRGKKIEKLSGSWQALHDGRDAWEQSVSDEHYITLGRKLIAAILDYLKPSFEIFESAALLQSDIDSAIDAAEKARLEELGNWLTELESAGSLLGEKIKALSGKWLALQRGEPGWAQLGHDKRYFDLGSKKIKQLHKRQNQAIEVLLAADLLQSDIDSAIDAAEKARLEELGNWLTELESAGSLLGEKIKALSGKWLALQRGEPGWAQLGHDKRYFDLGSKKIKQLHKRQNQAIEIFQAADQLHADIDLAVYAGDDVRLKKLGEWLTEIKSSGNQFSEKLKELSEGWPTKDPLRTKIEELSGNWPALRREKNAWAYMNRDKHYLGLGRVKISEALEHQKLGVEILEKIAPVVCGSYAAIDAAAVAGDLDRLNEIVRVLAQTLKPEEFSAFAHLIQESEPQLTEKVPSEELFRRFSDEAGTSNGQERLLQYAEHAVKECENLTSKFSVASQLYEKASSKAGLTELDAALEKLQSETRGYQLKADSHRRLGVAAYQARLRALQAKAQKKRIDVEKNNNAAVQSTTLAVIDDLVREIRELSQPSGFIKEWPSRLARNWGQYRAADKRKNHLVEMKLWLRKLQVSWFDNSFSKEAAALVGIAGWPLSSRSSPITKFSQGGWAYTLGDRPPELILDTEVVFHATGTSFDEITAKVVELSQDKKSAFRIEADGMSTADVESRSGGCFSFMTAGIPLGFLAEEPGNSLASFFIEKVPDLLQDLTGDPKADESPEFLAAHELDFRLHDTADQPELSSLVAHEMGLELINRAQATITLAEPVLPPSQTDPECKCHFILRFRHGTLVADLGNIDLDGPGDDWDIVGRVSHPEVDELYICGPEGRHEIQPGQSRHLALKQIQGADQGTRTTRVVLLYQGLELDGKPLSGHREKRLSVVNELPPEHREVPELPLHVGFDGPNRVLTHPGWVLSPRSYPVAGFDDGWAWTPGDRPPELRVGDDIVFQATGTSFDGVTAKVVELSQDYPDEIRIEADGMSTAGGESLPGSYFRIKTAVGTAGSTSNLRLQITNVAPASRQTPIRFRTIQAEKTDVKGRTTPACWTRSKVLLSFDFKDEEVGQQKGWALGTRSEVAAINPTLKPAGSQAGAWDTTNPTLKPADPKEGAWNATFTSQGTQAQWIFTPNPKSDQNGGELELRQGQALQLDIENIHTSLPSGPCNLYLRCENFPGFPDREYVLPVLKSPLVFHDGKAGIGTSDPQEKLQVAGNAKIDGTLHAAEAEVDGTVEARTLTGELNGAHITNETIALEKLVRTVQRALCPVGTVLAYAGSSSPDGWLLCDGNSHNRSEYSELYKIIKDVYLPQRYHHHPEGHPTLFWVPDLRGRVLVGLDSKTSSGPREKDTEAFRKLGQTGGEPTHKLSEVEMPRHQHFGLGEKYDEWEYGKLPPKKHWGSKGGLDKDNQLYGTTYTGGVTPIPKEVDGILQGQAPSPGEPHNNVQPYYVLNYIIKY